MTYGFEIRNAVLSDVDDLVGLLRELFSIEEDFSFDDAKQKKGLQLMLDGCGKHRAVKVAEKQGRVIGMCTVQTLISTAEGCPAGIVEDLIVSSDARGKGIGSALLEAVESWAWKRGITRLQLLADRENLPALDFYRERAWELTQLICLRRRPEGAV